MKEFRHTALRVEVLALKLIMQTYGAVIVVDIIGTRDDESLYDSVSRIVDLIFEGIIAVGLYKSSVTGGVPVIT